MAVLVDTYDTPDDLMLNSDQTGVPLIPSSDYTRTNKGEKDISTQGYGD